MSESTRETIVVKETLTTPCSKCELDVEKTILIEVEICSTQYNSVEYYGESGGRDVTVVEVEGWELSSGQDLTDAEFKAYESLVVGDIQTLVDRVDL